MEGCWRCGSLLHHRPACTADISPTQAASQKNAAKREKMEANPPFQQNRRRLEKYNQRRQIRNDSAPPLDIVSKEVKECLEKLIDLENEFRVIGDPCLCTEEFELCAGNINSENHLLQQQIDVSSLAFTVQNDILPRCMVAVEYGKNYNKSVKNIEHEEDVIFSTYVDDLDKNRTSLWQKISKMKSAMADVVTLRGDIMSMKGALQEELQQIEDVLRTSSRVSLSELEDVTTRLRDLKPLCQNVKQKTFNILKLTSSPSVENLSNFIDGFERRIEQAWDGRKKLVEEQLEKIICDICMDRQKEWVFRCGHSCCGQCLDSLRRSSNRICHRCRGSISNAVPFFP